MFASLNTTKGQSALAAALLMALIDSPLNKDGKPTLAAELESLFPPCDDPNCEACAARRKADAAKAQPEASPAPSDAKAPDAGEVNLTTVLSESAVALVGLNAGDGGSVQRMKASIGAFITMAESRRGELDPASRRHRALDLAIKNAAAALELALI